MPTPVAVIVRDHGLVPNRMTPVAERSVENVMTTLVVPDRLALISDGIDTR
jgi:hypothetical protein